MTTEIIWGTLGVLAGLAMAGCGEASAPSVTDADYTERREVMVSEQLAGRGRGIRDREVLEAMRKVPRHLFIPAEGRRMAYADCPVPIGYGQTISQPYVVAFMTEQLDPRPTDRVLEIGTGSGYQAAVLAELVAEVYTVEIVEPLARRAEEALRSLNYTNVHVRVGDGYQGWSEQAPFDAVIVTCAPDHVPRPLVDQLRDGGRLIIPVGERHTQNLVLMEKTGSTVRRRAVMPVRFVPMTGRAEEEVRREGEVR